VTVEQEALMTGPEPDAEPIAAPADESASAPPTDDGADDRTDAQREAAEFGGE
jgi:hypothetical protein